MYDLTTSDRKLKIGTLGVENIYREGIRPTVLFERFYVLCGGISCALVSGVAFNNGTANVVYNVAPEFRAKEILISNLA